MAPNSTVAQLHDHTDNGRLSECVRALDIYGDLAGSEAITRALVAERAGDRETARFWVGVFEGVVEREAKQTI